jgi:hypothetical protein
MMMTLVCISDINFPHPFQFRFDCEGLKVAPNSRSVSQPKGLHLLLMIDDSFELFLFVWSLTWTHD